MVGRSPEDFEAVRDVGPVVAQHVAAFFAERHNLEVVEKLRRSGVHWPEVQAAAASGEGALAGKSFVLTGTLSDMPRADAEEFIRRHGGRVSGSVSAKTSYLIAGEAAGSKLEKAQALGVTVLSESEFAEMRKGLGG
jgi:DNA ligase (NAD+)